MSIQQQFQLVGLGGLFLGLGVPAIVFWILSGTQTRRLGMALFLTTIAVWLLGYAYHISLAHPIALRFAMERGDTDYDGVGGNAAMLAVGWLPPLLVSLLGAWAARWRQRRRGATQV